MNTNHETFSQINGFLKPFSDLIISLFTSKTGIFVLVAFLILYVVFTILNAIHVRSLAYESISNGSRRRIPVAERLYIAGSSIISIFLKLVSNLPVLLGVIMLLLAIVGISSGLQSIDEFFNNQQRIKELQTILKHLDKRYEVAEISVQDVDRQNNSTSLSIKFYDEANGNYLNESQQFSLKGTDIYFDALVMNFDYSEVSSGNSKNIVIPYRVFSDAVAQDKGIKLNLKDKNGVPFIFHRDSAEIYGISNDKFNQRIKEISGYLTDKSAAKKAGIRSAYGNAVHRRVNKGDSFMIWVEQTGGLVIKDKVQF